MSQDNPPQLQQYTVPQGECVTVMIVEDNSKMRETIKSMILKNVSGVGTIHECADGTEAVKLYDQVRPDWVLMDIQMEPMDGLTASRLVMNAHPDARIIMLTGYGDSGYRKAAAALGIHAYVLKENLGEISRILTEGPQPQNSQS